MSYIIRLLSMTIFINLAWLHRDIPGPNKQHLHIHRIISCCVSYLYLSDERWSGANKRKFVTQNYLLKGNLIPSDDESRGFSGFSGTSTWLTRID